MPSEGAVAAAAMTTPAVLTHIGCVAAAGKSRLCEQWQTHARESAVSRKQQQLSGGGFDNAQSRKGFQPSRKDIASALNLVDENKKRVSTRALM